MRAEVAEECNRLYRTFMMPGDVNDCDGCRANTGRLFSGCMNCGIRRCAMGKNIESCAFCNGYICDILEKHFLLDPDARKRLEDIRLRL